MSLHLGENDWLLTFPTVFSMNMMPAKHDVHRQSLEHGRRHIGASQGSGWAGPWAVVGRRSFNKIEERR